MGTKRFAHKCVIIRNNLDQRLQHPNIYETKLDEKSIKVGGATHMSVLSYGL